MMAHQDGHSREREPTQAASAEGRVFDVQRFSIHDGPGIRTTVFLKGCPLRCRWCHNPEGISHKKQISFLSQKCIGCGNCFEKCPRQAHTLEGDAHLLDRVVCGVCGTCTDTCYSGALEIVGRDVTVDEVIAEVIRDQPFYECSGGGMTLSGGEPILQIDFTVALLQAAKEEGLHCAIETCGHGPLSRYERIFPYVDLYMYDIKEMDNQRHIESTGVPNELILSNLRELHSRGAQIIVRLPIIPGYNDRDDHFREVASLVKSLPDLLGVEIMPYHPLGTSKLDRFGFNADESAEIEIPSKEVVSSWIRRFGELGIELLNEGE